MIKGGKGGTNTNANRLAFEKYVDLPALLARKGFILEETKGGYFKHKKKKRKRLGHWLASCKRITV